MDLVTALDQTFAHAAVVAAGVRPEQLDDATPCTEWDVRALAMHTLGVVENIGRGVRGEALMPSPLGMPLEADLGAQYRRVMASTLAAWRAADLTATVDIGAGPMPGGAAAGINLLDTATHSWDLARATGQDPALPAALAEQVLAAAQGIVSPDIRGFAGFDPEVEVGPDADATARLVAFLGRRP